MSDGGSIVNELECRRDGRVEKVEVIVSRDSVEIGGWTFDREQLLFALGVAPSTSP